MKACTWKGLLQGLSKLPGWTRTNNPPVNSSIWGDSAKRCGLFISEGRHHSCRISCGGSLVLVDEAAEPVAAANLGGVGLCRRSRVGIWWAELEPAMRPSSRTDVREPLDNPGRRLEGADLVEEPLATLPWKPYSAPARYFAM
jgi:hypothetical protein